MKHSSPISTTSESNSPELDESFFEGVYTSIRELSIHTWNEILDTGDLTKLYREGEGIYTDRLDEVWVDLQEQHLKEFGISNEMKAHEQLMLKLARLQLKYLFTGDRSLLNLIEVAKHQLEQRSNVRGMAFGKQLVHARKFVGHAIDPKNTSVYEWFHILKAMQEHNDSSKGQ